VCKRGESDAGSRDKPHEGVRCAWSPWRDEQAFAGQLLTESLLLFLVGGVTSCSLLMGHALD